MPRFILIPAAIFIVLLLAALILAPLLLDEEKVLEIAATQLKEQTGATLTVDGETSLSLFPVLGISLEEASLAMPGEQQPGITVGALSIGVQMMPLLSGSVEIDSISVDGLKASSSKSCSYSQATAVGTQTPASHKPPSQAVPSSTGSASH